MDKAFNLSQLRSSISKIEPYLTEYNEFKQSDTVMSFKINDLNLGFEYEGHPDYDGDFVFIFHDKNDDINDLMYSQHRFIDKFKSFVGTYNREMLNSNYFRNKSFYSKSLTSNDRFLIKSFFIYFLTEIAINKLITNTLALSYELNDKKVDMFLLDLLVDENPFLETLSAEYKELIEYKKIQDAS